MHKLDAQKLRVAMLVALVLMGKVERRRARIEESVARYLSPLDAADLREPKGALASKICKIRSNTHPAPQ